MDLPYTIISYCCGTYPDIGGVARYDTQLKLIFPNRIFFIGPQQKNEMLDFLSNVKYPIIITDNHLSCDIPNKYPILLVHHGSALTHAEREPDWDPYWKNLCCEGQKKMLTYRNPINTWIISSSLFCKKEFEKYFGDQYRKFNNFLIPHSTEFNESIYKQNFTNSRPIILGNWNNNNKGLNVVRQIASNNTAYQFRQLNIRPNFNESLESFNQKKQEIYLNADIFLQLSLCEGNSYATLDALLCGLVIVASNVGLFYKDIPEDCFVKVEWERNNDIEYVMEKINYAWENRDILSKNARKWYLNNYRFIDWKNKMFKIINDFYNYNNKLIN